MVFDFPYHQVQTKYVEGSIRTQFGRGYEHVAPPSAPIQRRFVLHFPGMAYFTNEAGQLDPSIRPEVNLYRLILFYEAHQMHVSFTYPHPVFGDVTVRFNRPFEEPRGIPGGHGWTDPFELEFIEVR